MKPASAVAVMLLVLVSCTPSASLEDEAPAAQGPPRIEIDTVDQHAEQFDDDFPDRPPGSQHELAAASYILGHLQLAGYSPRLDRVPVADTVSSTNVVAFPPGGAEPEFLLTVPYDTAPSNAHSFGDEIGIFLELARALAVHDPHHKVAFVALGAETAEARGTRRLARFLLDEGVSPSVISLHGGRSGPQATVGVVVMGACQEGHGNEPSSLTRGTCDEPVDDDDVLTAAGFEHTWIGGDAPELARELFRFLTAARS